ncbi:MAG: FAD-dependent oxidoreductase [Gammaproteobacteria bacterium]
MLTVPVSKQPILSQLIRNPELASKRDFDLIVVGGGVHGAMLALEATRIGLSPLLLEKGDFGGATSFNSLRLIHGGFRYLQSLDYSRLRRSAAERRWFLKSFPHLVKPLPCMVPIYGKGLRRSSTLSIALRIYDYLTGDRNLGLQPGNTIPSGRMVSADEAVRIFPMVDRRGLQGGAIWYDGYVEDTQRLIIEVLRMACSNGATALNYTEVKQLVSDAGKVEGVSAYDQLADTTYTFRSDVVINAAGPWSRELARRMDRDETSLFRSMLAWNILFDREPVSDHGVAVMSRRSGSHTFFLVSWKNRLLAGTGQVPWSVESRRAAPTQEQIVDFIEDVNQAIPGLNLKSSDILYILSGLQSATKEGGKDFATKDIIFNHSSKGGVKGLFSVSGVKLTTSRYTAEKTLREIFPHNMPTNHSQDGFYTATSSMPPETWNYRCTWKSGDDTWLDGLRALIKDESVIHLDDLVFRRTTLWENPLRTIELTPQLCRLFDWDKDTARQEVERITRLMDEKRTN